MSFKTVVEPMFIRLKRTAKRVVIPIALRGMERWLSWR